MNLVNGGLLIGFAIVPASMAATDADVMAPIGKFVASDTKSGVTYGAVERGKPTRIETSGNAAYVIVPVVYTFKQQGMPTREPAQMTFVVKQNANGWLVHSWTWTGPAPEKAAAK